VAVLVVQLVRPAPVVDLDRKDPPMNRKAPRHLSLLKPTGRLTLGNYLGALRPLLRDGAEATRFLGIADLHALTVPHDPQRLRALASEMQLLLIACGVGSARTTLFVQSDVPAHAELSYLLECTTYTGELSRMIQFKEKGRGRPRTRAALYTYPVLMAADILLYRATEVPVGEDQRQHVELTRAVATRFNKEYGEVFTVPEITTPPVGARVMNLQDPTSKMGKSDDSGAGTIYLLDDPSVIAKKIGRAVTDSDRSADGVRHDRVAKPGVSNLLEIIAGCTDSTPDEVAKGIRSYGELKEAATTAVCETLAPIQQRYVDLELGAVAATYDAGAQRCRDETAPVLAAARNAMGLGG
jgi:tryptophanyl-tRNA synthetase